MSAQPITPTQLSFLRQLYCERRCNWSEEALSRLTATEATQLMRCMCEGRHRPTPHFDWMMDEIAKIIAASSNNTEDTDNG